MIAREGLRRRLRIGFIVDGDAEFAGLAHLLPNIDTPAELLHPVRADMHPHASASQIAHAAMKALRGLLGKNRLPDRIVVLIDHEGQDTCPPQLAREIADAVSKRCREEGLGVEVSVVLKVKMLENWLVADLEALRTQSARFRIDSSFERKVAPSKADSTDALALLKQAVRQGGYHKLRDAKRILEKADPMRMAANSRSFRRLLRVVGVERYEEQSKRP